MKYISASDITSTEDLKSILKNEQPINAIAIIGDSKLLSDLWNSCHRGVPKDETDLFICCVDYSETKSYMETELVNVRNTAVWELFRQWNSAGLNTKHAKSPFSCAGFKKFINIDKYCSVTTYTVFLKTKDN